MENYKLTIEGISPLLIHGFSNDFGEGGKVELKKAGVDHGTPREQAERHIYADDDGQVWIPSTWPKGAVMTCASEYKLPGSRKSLRSVLGGVVIPIQEKMYFEKKLYKKDLEIDSRPVAIQRSSSRVMRHRGRVEPPWRLSVTLQIMTKIVPPETILEVLNDAGLRSGVGDFRPSTYGSYGRFQVVGWKRIEQSF